MADSKPKATSKNLVVSAPLVRALGEDEKYAYLYRGDSLAGVKASEVERLIDLDMVADADPLIVAGQAHPSTTALGV